MESAATEIDSKIRRLHRLISKKVVIATKHGHSYEGKLVAFDHHTNLQLSRGVMFRYQSFSIVMVDSENQA